MREELVKSGSTMAYLYTFMDLFLGLWPHRNVTIQSFEMMNPCVAHRNPVNWWRGEHLQGCSQRLPDAATPTSEAHDSKWIYSIRSSVSLLVESQAYVYTVACK